VPANPQPISYPSAKPGPKTSSSLLATARGYLALANTDKNITENYQTTHSSPLNTMSDMVNTKPCRHNARKIPVSSYIAHMRFMLSGDRFRHLSVQIDVASRPSAGSPAVIYTLCQYTKVHRAKNTSDPLFVVPFHVTSCSNTLTSARVR
jgi:hypothetical protein